jgi:hypothetical protein
MKNAVVICRTEDKKHHLILEEGEVVRVVGRSKNKVKVNTEDGKTLWCNFRNLSEKLVFRG